VISSCRPAMKPRQYRGRSLSLLARPEQQRRMRSTGASWPPKARPSSVRGLPAVFVPGQEFDGDVLARAVAARPAGAEESVLGSAVVWSGRHTARGSHREWPRAL